MANKPKNYPQTVAAVNQPYGKHGPLIVSDIVTDEQNLVVSMSGHQYEFLKGDNTGQLKMMGDVYIEGSEQSLRDRLEKIEMVLGILPRSEKLEEEYPELQALGDMLEQEWEQKLEHVGGELRRLRQRYDKKIDECKVMEKMKHGGKL